MKNIFYSIRVQTCLRKTEKVEAKIENPQRLNSINILPLLYDEILKKGKTCKLLKMEKEKYICYIYNKLKINIHNKEKTQANH